MTQINVGMVKKHTSVKKRVKCAEERMLLERYDFANKVQIIYFSCYMAKTPPFFMQIGFPSS